MGSTSAGDGHYSEFCVEKKRRQQLVNCNTIAVLLFKVELKGEKGL